MSTVNARYALLASSQKPRQGPPAYTLYVNRWLGRWIAAACPSWITPNQLTLLSALVSYGALVLVWFVPSAPWSAWLIAPLLLLGYALDSADGQVSRLRGTQSRLGSWLDHSLDSGKIALLHISAGVYLARTIGEWSLVSLGASAAFLVITILIYTGGLLFAAASPPSDGRPGAPSAIRSFLMLPVDYGTICLAFLVLTWPVAFFWIYISLAAANLLFLIAYYGKWVRELSRLDRPQGDH